MDLSRRDSTGLRPDIAGLCLLVVVILLSRIPFLNAGYGAQMDAWTVANVARHLAQTGHYEASRLPGFPVQEITCALFWKGGPAALNGASAFFGTAAVMLFALIARSVGCKDWLLAGLALGFAQVFYINSVSAKDYTWALAFTLASLLACMKNRAVMAGILLGIATGCRLTSCVAWVPLAIILTGDDKSRALRQAAVFAVVSAITATIVFLPVMQKYGLGFLTTYYHDFPDWQILLERSTVEVWGWTGIAGLGIALAGIVWKRARPAAIASLSCADYHTVAWIAAAMVYLAVYFSHPDLAGYLIPLIPFVILLLAKFSARPAFQAFCVLVMAGAFVTIDHGRVVAGGIFQDHAERLRTSESIANFIAFTDQIPGRNVFVIGSWKPEIDNRFPERESGDHRCVYLLEPLDVLQCIKSRTAIYYDSPTLRYFNFSVFGVDLAKYGGRDIRTIYEQKMKAGREDAPKGQE